MISLKQILIVMPLVQIFSPSTEEEESKQEFSPSTEEEESNKISYWSSDRPLCPGCGNARICTYTCEVKKNPQAPCTLM